MNSVFLAFKSNKNSDNKTKSCSSVGGGGGGGINNTCNNAGSTTNGTKKLNQELTEYENLRHIREIGSSSSNMSTYVDNEDLNVSPIKLGKRCPTPIQPIPPSFTLLDGNDVVDFSGGPFNEFNTNTKSDIIDGQLKRQKKDKKSSLPPQPPPAPLKFIETQVVKTNSIESKSEVLDNCLSNKINYQINFDSSRHSSSSIDRNSSCNNVSSSNRLNRPRLSLSGLGSNNVMPSVHGRQCNANNSTGNASGTHKTRLSTHQRNLSLDFR